MNEAFDEKTYFTYTNISPLYFSTMIIILSKYYFKTFLFTLGNEIQQHALTQKSLNRVCFTPTMIFNINYHICSHSKSRFACPCCNHIIHSIYKLFFSRYSPFLMSHFVIKRVCYYSYIRFKRR